MPLTDNLQANYPLSEASGSAIAAVGGSGLDLTDNGGVGSRVGAGGVGTARDFPGSDSIYLSHSDDPALSCGDVDWSVLFWFIVDGSLGSFPVIATKGRQEGTGWEWIAYLDSSGNLKVQNRNETDGSMEIGWSTPLSTGVWRMVAFGNNSTANEFWVSVNAGTPVTSTVMHGTNDGGGSLRLGSCPAAGTGPLDGGLQEFSFFKRDIRTDLMAFYNSGTPLPLGGSPPPPPAVIDQTSTILSCILGA